MQRAILLTLLLILAACGGPFDSDIRREYTTTARQLGIVPVYPPREEFQIGDVFVVSFGYDPETGEVDVEDRVDVWVGDFPEMAALAEDFMASRIVFQTSASPPTPAGQHTRQPDFYQGGLTRRGDVTIETLPLAAFPSISADAGFTSGLGIVRTLQALGLAGGNRTRVRLEFDDVRTYWVERTVVGGARFANPAGVGEPVNLRDAVSLLVVRLLDQSSLDGRNTVIDSLEQELINSRSFGRNPSGDRCTAISVVTRVYLTREIDFTYFNSEIIAAGIRRAEQGATLSEVPDAPRVTINVDNDSNGAVFQGDPDADVSLIRGQIDALGSEGGRGTGINFESWNALGITFSQSFSRPVAIGYEGYSLPTPIQDSRNLSDARIIEACPTTATF